MIIWVTDHYLFLLLVNLGWGFDDALAGLEDGRSDGSEVASELFGGGSEFLSPEGELEGSRVLESEGSLVSDEHIVPVHLADLDDGD